MFFLRQKKNVPWKPVYKIEGSVSIFGSYLFYNFTKNSSQIPWNKAKIVQKLNVFHRFKWKYYHFWSKVVYRSKIYQQTILYLGASKWASSVLVFHLPVIQWTNLSRWNIFGRILKYVGQNLNDYGRSRRILDDFGSVDITKVWSKS